MTSFLREKMLWKVTVARILMWVCLSASVLPALVAIVRFVALPNTPEKGFEGMALMFAVFTWGPILLFPLLGFALALGWKRRLEGELQSENAEPGASPNGGPAMRSGNSEVGGGPPSVS